VRHISGIPPFNGHDRLYSWFPALRRLTETGKSATEIRNERDEANAARTADAAAESARATADRASLRERLASGAYIPERLPPGTVSGGDGGALQTATEIALRSHGELPEDQSREFARQLFPVARQRDYLAHGNAVRPLEEKALRNWARAHGKMLNEAAFEQNWKTKGEKAGAEHDVYFSQEEQRWYKRNNLCYHANWLEYFHRIALHNQLFPEALLRFEGFVDHEGKLQPVVSQPDVSSERGATEAEVDAHMATKGFARMPRTVPDKPNLNFLNPDTGVRVEDLHDENVVVTPEGNTVVIDPVLYMDMASKMRRMREAAEEPLPR
jgi:hypothetical protein